jgi:hypothetical protein
MKLKFIGKDGSMGFKHGKVYDVRLTSNTIWIWVHTDVGLYCPYSSPQAFADNWASVKEK